MSNQSARKARQYVKIYCCGECANYTKRRSCALGATDESDPYAHFFLDCPHGVKTEDEQPARGEMSAKEFLVQFSRMCATYPAYGVNTGCKGCPLEQDATCDLMRSELADHYIEIVSKWAKEHPERSEELPPADVKPVVRGEWIFDAECGVTKCSSCQWSIEENFYDPTSNEAYPYCPNCGADMKGAKKNEGDSV